MVLPAVMGGIALADWLLGGAIAAAATKIWYNNGGKEALNQTGNAIANSMSDADEQAPAQLGSETETSTCSTGDVAPKFYPVLSSLQRFWVAVFGAVAAGCGAEPFRLRSTASRRGLIV